MQIARPHCPMNRLRNLVLCTLVAGWAHPAGGLGAGGPDLKALAETGRRSAARLEKEGASWTAVTTVNGTARVTVRTVALRDRRRIRVAMAAGGAERPAATIVERDGGWFVDEPGGIRGKYRPFEAPFYLPTMCAFLGRSELMFLTDADTDLGKYEKTDRGVATYRSPLPPQWRQMLRGAVKQFNALKQRGRGTAELEKMLAGALDLLENGVPTAVDLKTGLLTKFGTETGQTEIHAITWTPAVDPQTFDVKGKWHDFTDDPTEGDVNDLVMIAHYGFWRPGHRSKGDPDARLLNLKTGRMRRVPFAGMISMPGCFLKGRKKVVVCGMPAEGGKLGLYEVDLSTGANRELGANVFKAGFCFGPCLSADGKRLAVKFVEGADVTRPSPIVLVDVDSGRAWQLGRVVGGIHLSWLPDGKRILMLREEFEALDRPSVTTICTMDMKGGIRDIIPGGDPLLLDDGRVLFKPRGKRLWHTCDLTGKNVRLYADGLASYGFPTASPDGTRLLMMHFVKTKGPRPVVLKIGASSGGPATKLPGLWAWPAWR